MTLKEYKERLLELGLYGLKVGLAKKEGGLHKTDRYVQEDGTVVTFTRTDVSLFQTAVWNEYGTATIPARRAYRATAFHPEIRAEVAALGLDLRDVLRGQGTARPAMAFATAGTRILAHLKSAIIERTRPRNAPYTVKRKGFDDPLVNTRQFERSQSWQVTRRGQKVRKGGVEG